MGYSRKIKKIHAPITVEAVPLYNKEGRFLGDCLVRHRASYEDYGSYQAAYKDKNGVFKEVFFKADFPASFDNREKPISCYTKKGDKLKVNPKDLYWFRFRTEHWGVFNNGIEQGIKFQDFIGTRKRLYGDVIQFHDTSLTHNRPFDRIVIQDKARYFDLRKEFAYVGRLDINVDELDNHLFKSIQEVLVEKYGAIRRRDYKDNIIEHEIVDEVPCKISNAKLDFDSTIRLRIKNRNFWHYKGRKSFDIEIIPISTSYHPYDYSSLYPELWESRNINPSNIGEFEEYFDRFYKYLKLVLPKTKMP
jgi:hypothetical protein